MCQPVVVVVQWSLRLKSRQLFILLKVAKSVHFLQQSSVWQDHLGDDLRGHGQSSNVMSSAGLHGHSSVDPVRHVVSVGIGVFFVTVCNGYESSIGPSSVPSMIVCPATSARFGIELACRCRAGSGISVVPIVVHSFGGRDGVSQGSSQFLWVGVVPILKFLVAPSRSSRILSVSSSFCSATNTEFCVYDAPICDRVVRFICTKKKTDKATCSEPRLRYDVTCENASNTCLVFVRWCLQANTRASKLVKYAFDKF